MDKRIGNSFWKLRSTSGRDKIFATPETLWQEAEKYFEHCEGTPLQEQHVFANGLTANTDKMRAFTLQGLQYFLSIGETTWRHYKNRKEYQEVCERIEQAIWNQKFTGAAAGLLNPAIIARELGLVDQQSLQLSKVPDQRDYSLLSDEEINQLAQIENKLTNGKKTIDLLGSVSPETI